MTREVQKQPYVIVVGNEKGGTGKSTLSMHIIVNFLRDGLKVGSIDTDARQGSLSRYMENREKFAKTAVDKWIPVSQHYSIYRSALPNTEDSLAEEGQNFLAAILQLSACDIVVIDTPGTDSTLSQLAHSYADTLITPLNDSLIDFDMLARVEGNDVRPSKYAEMVWEQKKNRALRDGGSIDWIILRNRLSSINARNKGEMERLVQTLSKRIGVRTIDGFGERVIFRELFLQGLTLLDLRELGITPNLSHIAARQEVRALIDAIKIPSASMSPAAVTQAKVG